MFLKESFSENFWYSESMILEEYAAKLSRNAGNWVSVDMHIDFVIIMSKALQS